MPIDGILPPPGLSPAYETVWGRSRESLKVDPKSWLRAVHPEDRERVQSTVAAPHAGKSECTYRIHRSDGSLRWIRERCFPVRDADGRVYRVAGVSRDITDYRRLEDQFRHAQKMEAVGRLAGGVAHDFNNLLSIILTYTTFVLENLATGDPNRADVEQVKRAGERAATLTRQLLALSRQQVMQPEVIELRQVVLDMEDMLRRLLGADVSLWLVPSAAPGRVYLDPSQLEQIIMNLAVNARDAMPRGGNLTIEVGTAELDESEAAARPGLAPGSYVTLAVTDTGAGMDASTRERVFEPFFTTKAKGKGTGLGLSTVFGIVKQSEGHIHVYSEPGVGTTFKIHFPSTERSPRAPSAPPSIPATLRGTETILLVEDDEQVREMIRTVLQRNGYQVLAAQNPGEAMLVSEQTEGKLHLLLTDVVMPLMSGRELAERLAPGRIDMKVLYISGYTEQSVVHHGVLDDGVAYLQKPITPAALLRKVREALTR